MIVETITAPVYARADKSAIDCIVRFEWLDEDLPFTATADDPEEHGREIWQRLQDGEAGPIEAYVSPAPIIPASVTMRQAKLVLLEADLLDDADAAIAAMPGKPGRAAQIEWATATELRRDHPLVAGLGQSLGLDDAAIDGLFVQAAQIQ